VQNTEPGSRLPHCEIRLLSSNQHSSSARATSAALSCASQGSAGPLHESSSKSGSHAGNLNRLDDRQQNIISMHDLLDASTPSLLLLIGQGSAAAMWAAAAHGIDREARIFKILQLLDGPGSGGAMQANSLAGLQGITVAEDVSGRWQTLRQVLFADTLERCPLIALSRSTDVQPAWLKWEGRHKMLMRMEASCMSWPLGG